MAIAKTFWLRLRETVISLWIAFAEVLIAFVEDFVEEVIFRVGLACRILAGRVPLKAERRWWNRSLETPVLVDVVDFSDERLLFSVLIWPALESGPRGFDSDRAHRERVEEVLAVIAKGAAEQMWSTRWDADWGLEWDPGRRAWVATDGFAYDGERLFEYSRNGSA